MVGYELGEYIHTLLRADRQARLEDRTWVSTGSQQKRKGLGMARFQLAVSGTNTMLVDTENGNV